MVMEARIQSGRGLNQRNVHVVIVGRRELRDRRDAGALIIAAGLDSVVTSISLIRPGRSQYTECPVPTVALQRMLAIRPVSFTPRCFATPYTRGMRISQTNHQQEALSDVATDSHYTFTPQNRGRILARFVSFPAHLPADLSIPVQIVFISSTSRGVSSLTLDQVFTRNNPLLRVPDSVTPGTYQVHIVSRDYGLNSVIDNFQVTPNVSISNLHRLTNVPNGYMVYEFFSSAEGFVDISAFSTFENIHVTEGLNRILIPLDGQDESQSNLSITVDEATYRPN